MPQPYVYSAREYGNMLMCLGEARGNASLALRIYRERHPNVRHPSDSRKIARLLPLRQVVGDLLMYNRRERILEVVRRNPRLGTRSAAKLLRRRNGSVVSHWLVHKVLRRERMRPYKVHKVHALVPGDRERRLNYCRWLVGHQQRSRFIEHVIWTDEATFTRNGLWNRRNAHVWSQTNPYACQQTGRQTRWSVNVWAGIYNGQILGPVPNYDAPSSCGNISTSPPLHRDECGTIRAPPCSIAKDLVSRRRGAAQRVVDAAGEQGSVGGGAHALHLVPVPRALDVATLACGPHIACFNFFALYKRNIFFFSNKIF
ncbi:hypothetical protein SFRURICE_005116 [Spodoptera frugiperda]|nr:hypothetical protein SFRURICE_005116 [Spodoptera frugiperda]